MKKSNGITLIALVITIVVLIILASVAITLSLGENGIFKKAAKAKEDTQVAQNEESMQIAEATNSIDEIVGSSRDTVTLTTEQYNEIMNKLNTLETKVNNSIGFVDYNNVLTTITTQGASWTATEDCAIVGGIRVTEPYAAELSVNGKSISVLYNNLATSSNPAQINSVSYVKKGSIVTTRAGHGIYSFTAYGLQK